VRCINTYRISANSFLPWIVSAHLCTVTFGFPLSKKNSFRGNYSRKYGIYKVELLSENCMKRTNYKVAHPPMHFELHFRFLLKSAGPRYPSSGFKKLLKSSCLRIEKIFFNRSFLITLSVKQISEWKIKTLFAAKNLYTWWTSTRA
jgi:hypothetical protein